MKQYKRKLYIVTNFDKMLKTIYFYEFTKRKEAEEFYKQQTSRNREYNQYNLITIDGNGLFKKAQSIKLFTK